MLAFRPVAIMVGSGCSEGTSHARAPGVGLDKAWRARGENVCVQSSGEGPGGGKGCGHHAQPAQLA